MLDQYVHYLSYYLRKTPVNKNILLYFYSHYFLTNHNYRTLKATSLFPKAVFGYDKRRIWQGHSDNLVWRAMFSSFGSDKAGSLCKTFFEISGSFRSVFRGTSIEI